MEKVKYLDNEEIKRFFEVIKSPRDRLIFSFLYHYGLRVGEACSLKLADLGAVIDHAIRPEYCSMEKITSEEAIFTMDQIIEHRPLVDYYTLEEVKDIFKEYINIRMESFDIFCNELQRLPKNLIDKIAKEVHFVLFDKIQGEMHVACSIPLDELHDKKLIIILTPYIFGARYLSTEGKYITHNKCSILHEIAHYELGHCAPLIKDRLEHSEEEADKQMNNWIDDWDESNHPAKP